MNLDYGESSDHVDQPEEDEQDEQQNDQSGPQEVGKADPMCFPSAICGGPREVERHTHPSLLQTNCA